MPQRSSHYCCTKHAPDPNQPGPSDWLRAFCLFLDTLVGQNITNKTKCSYVVYQCEKCPETGKHHVQFYFQTASEVAWKSVKKFWNDKGYPDLHFEHCKGSDQQNYEYCTKTDSRLEDSPSGEHGERRTIAKRTGQGSREDIDRLKADIEAGMPYRELLDQHFGTIARHHNFTLDFIETVRAERLMAEMQDQMESAVLRPWQQQLLTMVLGAPDTRKIHWIWEDVGNVGKSWMAKYLSVMHGALIMTAMRKADMNYLFSKHLPKILCIDLARTNGEGSVETVMEFVEHVKTGYICSGKYNSRAFHFAQPVVCIFSNSPPPLAAVSADRWDVWNLANFTLPPSC